MDRKIRLVKGMSYTGHGLKVSRKDPEIATDEATAKKAVASGYFEYVTEPEHIAIEIGEEAPVVYEEEIESEGTGEIMDETEAGEEDPDLEGMTVAQLKALAAEMGISTKGLRSRADFLAAIQEATDAAMQV